MYKKLNIILNFILIVVLCGLIFITIFNSGKYGFYIYVILLSVLATILFISLIKSTINYIRERKYSYRTFAWMSAKFMGLFFITGTLLSALALNVIHQHNYDIINNLELVFRSVLLSLDLFLLDLEGNIVDHLPDYPALRSLLVIQAFLSFLCTLFLFINIIFTQLKGLLIYNLKWKIKKEKNHLYIFFGINETVKILVEDLLNLKQSDIVKDKKATVLFVDFYEVKEEEDSLDSGISPIMNMFVNRRDTFKYADETGALVTSSTRQFLDLSDEEIEEAKGDILGKLGLGKIKDFILSLSNDINDTDRNAQLNIFFFSDNYRNNLRNIAILSKDKTLQEILNPEKRIHEKPGIILGSILKIYNKIKKENFFIDDNLCQNKVDVNIFCRSRFNVISKEVEDMALNKGIKMITIDSTQLAIQLVKSTPEFHPIRLMQLSKKHPGTVSHAFEALLLGFEAEGQEAFKFLYEFGRFIGEGSTIDNVKVVKPKIKICAKGIEDVIGRFIYQHPGIDFNEGNISFIDTHTSSMKFYSHVITEDFCKSVNYIMITSGQDYDNISLAARLFNYIRRFRNNFENLIILVRCTNDENINMMTKIAKHYNEGYGEGEKNKPVIHIYGKPKDIYSFETIVRERFVKLGMEFNKKYIDKFESNCNLEKTNMSNNLWRNRRILMNRSKLKNENMDILNQFRNLRRQESQDIANAFHGDTKMYILRKSYNFNMEEENKLRDMIDGILNIDENKLNIHKRYENFNPNVVEILYILGMLEHERWVASHELLGYKYDEEINKNERFRRMTHNMMKRWDQLADENKIYDLYVVENTILIKKK